MRKRILAALMTVIMTMTVVCSPNVIAQASIDSADTGEGATSDPVEEDTSVNIVIENDETGIPDTVLYNSILAEADENKDGILTEAEARAITHLEVWGNETIENLQGISWCTGLTSLFLSSQNINDISELSQLVQLQILYLDYNEIDNLSALSHLKNLSNLSLRDCGINDITVLGELTQLECLYLDGNEICDIEVLSNLTKLEELWIEENNISDTDGLQDLSSLKELYLNYNPIVDFSGIAELENLTRLSIRNMGLEDISMLEKLTNLRYLDVAYNRIEDISVLINLTNLENLDLENNRVRNVDVLDELPNLVEVDLNYNPIGVEGDIIYCDEEGIPDKSLHELIEWTADINSDGYVTTDEAKELKTIDFTIWWPVSLQGIRYLENLEYLKLDNGNINDLGDINKLKHLQHLDLSENEIVDITPLAELEKLQYLDLSYNNITDISAVSQLPNLEYLNVEGNPIEAETPPGVNKDFTIENGVLEYYSGEETNVVIPEGVTKIAYGAFTNDDWIESITIPDTVKEIDGWAFYFCENLKEINLPDSIIEIGEYAFKDCSSLKEIVIPGSVKVVKRNLFDDCISLRSVKLSEGVQTIESGVFYGCEKLETIEFPESLEDVCTGALQGTAWLEENQVLILNDVLVDADNNLKGDYMIPYGVTLIGEMAFGDCENLVNVYIPETVTSIESDVFRDCPNLGKVYVPASVIHIGDNAFVNTLKGDYSYAENFVLCAPTGSYAQLYRYYDVYNTTNEMMDYEPSNGEGDVSPYIIPYDCDAENTKSFMVNLSEVVGINKTYPIEITNNVDAKYILPKGLLKESEECKWLELYSELIMSPEKIVVSWKWENQVFTKDDFVALYDGGSRTLNGMTVSIPVGKAWSGKEIYCYHGNVTNNHDGSIFYAGLSGIVDQDGYLNLAIKNADLGIEFVLITKEPDTPNISDKPSVPESDNSGTNDTVVEVNSGWKKDSTGWWYQRTDGSYPANAWEKIDEVWYAFDARGYMREGWFKDGATWYYLKPDSGAMATGWVKDGGTWYYMNSSGAMQTGWVKDGSTWYYMKPSGAMATGWVKDGSTWYYMNSSGAMQTGWVKDGSTWYYMKSSGAMATGWVKDGGTWYYMNGSGAMQTGWIYTGGKWYYMYASGAMAANTWIGSYYVDKSGAWVA